MPFKPNYNHRRSERRHAQQQKRDEKARCRAEKVALRKAAQGAGPPPEHGPANT